MASAELGTATRVKEGIYEQTTDTDTTYANTCTDPTDPNAGSDPDPDTTGGAMSIVWRPALVRSLRSFLQGCAAVLLAFVTWLSAQSVLDWGEIRIQGSKFLLGVLLALSYALLSLVQNLLEDNFFGDRARRLKG